MPKIKGNKTRVHTKAVGSTSTRVTPLSAPTTVSASALVEVQQQQQQLQQLESLNAQFGLELEDDRESKKDKRKQRHDKWMSKLEATYNPQKKKKKSAAQQTLSVDFGTFHDVLSTIDPLPTLSSTSSSSTTSASLASHQTASSAIEARKEQQRQHAQQQSTAARAKISADQQQQYTIHADSSKPLQSKKAKKRAAMQEILRFQNVLAHPAFKTNPLLTIQQHVKNTMEMAPPEGGDAMPVEDIIED